MSPHFALLSLQCLFAVAYGSGAHGGGAHEWEWAGIFDTPEDVYGWIAQKVEGNTDGYADPKMKMAILPVTSTTGTAAEQLEALEGEGEHAFKDNGADRPCTQVLNGQTMTPQMDTCYQLNFLGDLYQSTYMIKTGSTARVAIFAEHFPTEFESSDHYLKDDHGDDVEPLAQEPEPAAPAPAPAQVFDGKYGEAIGASILVNIMTFAGVVLAVPFFTHLAKTNEAEFHSVLSGFCAGAVLSCAFFLLLFEATHLIMGGWTEEVEVLWRWGTAVLGGFLLPTVIDLITVGIAGGDGETKVTSVDVSAEKTATTDEPTKGARARVLSAVLIGDFFHNLCDGFFIGAAFKVCGGSFGWTVTLSTCLHEVPQELADYALLTGSIGKLSALVALALNFITGLSVCLGAIIVQAADVANADTGLLLAFGGGTYLHIAAVECMPKLYAPGVSTKARLLSVFMFVLGTILIGLVLLDHKHCAKPLAPGEVAADPHAGHNH